jgi:two-component system cell cycle sensor histidine kinase/response regulator CckA
MILRKPNGELALPAASLLEALQAPACVARLDGVIAAANLAWTEACGPARRLPEAWNLYLALNRARDEGRAEAPAPIDARTAVITMAGERLFLVRLETPPAAPVAMDGPGLDPLSGVSPFGIALIVGEDPFSGAVAEANLALKAMAGEGPCVRLEDVIDTSSLAEARAQHAAGHAGPFEAALAAAPERAVHLHLAQAGGRSLVYVQDVTEQRQMQSRLAQRNRMESVGQLAGGVAHDFNNLLTAIRLRTDELLLRHALGDPSYESLAEIRETVGRAADVVRQLLTFSRKATLQREVLDLGEALTDTAVLLRRLVREDVELAIDYGPNLPRVRIDRSQLETAVINLVVNARDALRAKGGGTVRIRTARLTGGAARDLGYAGPEVAELALLEVADDGPGIAPEALAKVFEPFFTTKAVGEGTGLGLATVYGVVKQAEGWITAASVVGEGATFRIFLPVYAPPLAFEPATPAETPRRAPRDLSGVGRILFVEDEAMVRGVAARLLRARGYEVLEAADGEQALALAEAHTGAIDLMISDVIMPGMDGPALLKAARPFIGAAPVMFISGYAEAEFSDLLEGEEGVSFLPKPLDIKTLAERVKAELRPPERAA